MVADKILFMELKLKSKKKDSIEFELMNVDETLVQPLISQLLLDKDVEIARYNKPRIFIKVKKGKPQTMLEKVVENIAKEFGNCRKSIKEK